MANLVAAAGAGAGVAAGTILLVLIVGLVGVAAYFLPTIIGASRHVVNIGSVFAINLLLGWTLIGWAVALALALRTNPPYASFPWQPTPGPGQQMPGLPPPGWYPDPGGTGGFRWWDGQSWTGPHQPPGSSSSAPAPAGPQP